MKHLFCKWLAAMLIAALMLTGTALTEENVGAVEAVAELEEITVEPVEDVEAPVGEEALVDFVEEAAEPETEDGDEAEEPDAEAVEEALPEPVTEEAADAILEEETVEAPEVVEEQTDEAAKLMEGEEGIPVDEAHFPDAALREYISKFFDHDGNGYLSQQERDEVTYIGGDTQDNSGGRGFYTMDRPTGDIKWSLGVSSLQGIEYFPNMASIDCSYNPIASLDVSMLGKLMVLKCWQCGVVSLNVSGCKNLFDLRIQKNAMTSLDLTNCQYFAGFPKGFKNEKGYYHKKLAAPVPGSEHVNGVTNNGSVVVLLCDQKLKINGAAKSGTQTGPAGAVEVPGAATATVTVAANSTAKRTIMTAVAAPGAKMQLDLGGATGKQFKSSKKKVAGVNKNGVITFKKAGKTKITYKVGKKKRTVVLTVVDPTLPTSVSIDPVTTDVKKGDTVTLNATLPAGTTSAIKWKTSNKKVATVNNGVVRFKKAGRVTITAITKRGKKKASVAFNVSK